MESRAFIETATALREDIATFRAAHLSMEDEAQQGNALQKRINSAFSGLHNPTLPSVSRLANEAMSTGFEVEPQVLHKITQAEYCWR